MEASGVVGSLGGIAELARAAFEQHQTPRVAAATPTPRAGG